MDKPIVKLNRQDIKDKITHGDRIDGSRYWLAVALDGSSYQIHWLSGHAQWNPWPPGWLAIPIPALFPDGHGFEQEAAEDVLKDLGHSEEIEQARKEDISLPDWVERHHPDEWQERLDNMLDWELDAFLAACNGDGTDLSTPAPWGEERDQFGYPVRAIEPPAEFEWSG